MQIQVKQSYKGKHISSLYRFPFVYSKRPNIGPADYWSLTLQSGIKTDSDDDYFDASLPSCLRECPRITGADVHRNSYNNECTIVLEGT